jgi:hypothetical protein
MSQHATLSASGAKRWLTCPPSALLEAEEPDSSSDYAAEGTAAHEMAEKKLSLALGKITKGTYTRWYNSFKANCEYFNSGFEDDVDKYVGMVMEQIAEYDDPFVDLEKRVDFSTWVPEGFGTADVVVIDENILHVIDLKFGKGVPVSAEENPQLMLYALGAVAKYEIAYDFEKVAMTIIQPRLDSSSTYIMPLDKLLDWAENYVRPRAELAIEGKGEFEPSEEGCRFCRVRAKCKARADKQMEVAKLEFAEEPPEFLTPEQTAYILEAAPVFAKWLSDVQEHALTQARDHGVHYPGWKIVEGRSNRVITNSLAAKETLDRYIDLEYEQYMSKPQLLGITALEKNLGKELFMEALGGLIDKPTGKPVLVPESDKRPEMNSNDSARADFEELIEE